MVRVVDMSTGELEQEALSAPILWAFGQLITLVYGLVVVGQLVRSREGRRSSFFEATGHGTNKRLLLPVFCAGVSVEFPPSIELIVAVRTLEWPMPSGFVVMIVLFLYDCRVRAGFCLGP